MPPQAWQGTRRPRPDLFKPMDGKGDEPGLFKPEHGRCIWTSTYDPRHISAWCQWRIIEGFRCDPANPIFQIWQLDVEPDAKVFEIDSYADLETLVERYPQPPDPLGGDFLRDFPNWPAVAQDFDGVHLTERGQWDTRLSHPYSLYGWDCESTLWFRWCFTDVLYRGLVRVQPDSYDD